MKYDLCGATAALAVFLTGCLPDEPFAGNERFAFLAQRATEVRELEYLRPVPVVVKTRAQFSAEQAHDAEEADEEDLAELTDTYGRLGYFPLDTDLRDVFAGSSDWVGGSYDSTTETILVIGEERDSLIVHEFVHALQDQHFDLDAYEVSDTSDHFLARRAATEGDAVLAEQRFYLQDEYGVDLDQVDWPGLVKHNQERPQKVLSEWPYPVLFAAYQSFTYPRGILYCAHNLTGITPPSVQPTKPRPWDWSLEDELFTERPPASTQQVIELDEADPPVAVGLQLVPRVLDDRLETADWDTLGEWYTYLLLYPLDGAEGVGDVEELATLWRGDGVLFASDRASGDVGVTWASAWKDEAAATRVEAAMWTLHGAKPDAREARLGLSADGEVVWIERRGARVVAIKNVAAEIAPALAEEAFDEGPAAKPMSARTRRSLAARMARLRPGSIRR